MDPNALAGMVFTLVLATLIGGFVLLFPLSKRLGTLLESKIKEPPPQIPNAEIERLSERIQSLETQVRQLNDRQEFAERLIGERQQDKLTGG